MKREEWIRHNFGDVTQTFSNGVVTASDLSSLLEKIETDLSLVHAAYYTEMSALSGLLTGSREGCEATRLRMPHLMRSDWRANFLLLARLPAYLVALQELRNEA